MFRMSFGVAIILIAAILDTALAFSAAAAAHLDFWQYAMLNKFGIFMLVMNFNAPAALGLIAASIIGFAIYAWGRATA